MTLLNTVQNLGGNWPSTLALWMVDFLTWKSCAGGTESNLELDCDNKVEAKVRVKTICNGKALQLYELLVKADRAHDIQGALSFRF